MAVAVSRRPALSQLAVGVDGVEHHAAVGRTGRSVVLHLRRDVGVLHLEGCAERGSCLSADADAGTRISLRVAREGDVVGVSDVRDVASVDGRRSIDSGAGADVGAFELQLIRPHVVGVNLLVPLMLGVVLQGRRDDEPQLADALGNGHRIVLGDDAGPLAIDAILREIAARAVLHECHVAHAEAAVGAGAAHDVVALAVLRILRVAIEIFTRVGIGQCCVGTQARQMGGDVGSGLGHLQGNDVEARALRTGGQCHLIVSVGSEGAAVGEVADVVVAIRFADVQVPRDEAASLVEVELIEVAHGELLIIHEHLVEVLHRSFRIVPDVSHGLDVAVELAQVVEEPVGLVAVPLMGVGVVMRVAEHADALVVHLLRVRLVGLPLSRLLPGDAAVAHSPVEARLARAVSTVVGCL